jgi:hypothetical protein
MKRNEPAPHLLPRTGPHGRPHPPRRTPTPRRSGTPPAEYAETVGAGQVGAPASMPREVCWPRTRAPRYSPAARRRVIEGAHLLGDETGAASTARQARRCDNTTNAGHREARQRECCSRWGCGSPPRPRRQSRDGRQAIVGGLAGGRQALRPEEATAPIESATSTEHRSMPTHGSFRVCSKPKFPCSQR